MGIVGAVDAVALLVPCIDQVARHLLRLGSVGDIRGVVSDMQMWCIPRRPVPDWDTCWGLQFRSSDG
jgi:hypothetical protein